MLTDSLIFEEFSRMARTVPQRVFWDIDAEVIADGRRIPVPNVIAKDTVRDYEGQYGDEAYVVLQIGMATYKDLIIPKKDNLKIRIIKTAQNSQGLPITAAPREVITYDAHMLDPMDIDLASPSRGYENQQINELSQLVKAPFQLTEPKLTEMRLADISGVYYNTTTDKLLEGLMAYDLDDSKDEGVLSSPSYDGIRGVDIIRGSNQTVYKTIMVKTGTRLVKLPKLLQRMKGVYTSGINGYFQAGRWYVYPLYDYTRFNSTTKRLTIINMPRDEMASPETSYDVRAEQVFIVATGDTQLLDDSEKIAKNVGTGLRFVKADMLIDGMSKSSKNKTNPNYEKTNKSFSIEERRDGLQNAPMSAKRITDNPYTETSLMAKGQGMTVKVHWENANPKLLYPAMPVKIIYKRADEVKSAVGTLLGVRISEAPGTGMMTDNDYRTNCDLIVHVQKRVE